MSDVPSEFAENPTWEVPEQASASFPFLCLRHTSASARSPSSSQSRGRNAARPYVRLCRASALCGLPGLGFAIGGDGDDGRRTRTKGTPDGRRRIWTCG
ncbi:hypothetical protein U9M48_040973 [Paspalum notatum var. saurae]|uniref:Uncharacterized protein n=1 Tax=Paspalum notatum var. saurae TaxID=547442 RepID=A0AAQ3UN85_PASNO